jgi:ribosomal protein S18 acetylase RimI-like enzyme
VNCRIHLWKGTFLDAATLALSRRCEENARASAARQRVVTTVGPFQALLDRYDELIWLNYAVPVAPLGDLRAARAALDELRAVFAASKRRLRFEYHAGPWPDVSALLQAEGLTLQAAHPTMVCTPADLQSFAVAGITTAILDGNTPDEYLVAFRDIQAEGFGVPRTALDAPALDRMRERLELGDELLALSLVDGQPASAAGLYPLDGVAELAGVATRESLRRRGAAASVSAALVGHFFAHNGQLAWLSAGDAAAEAVYTKVGFRTIDTRFNYIEE